MWFYKKRGFTLLELMIVVIIVGILATLALPRFMTGAARARWAAAVSTLGIIRGAQLRYYAENETYSSAMANLDITMDSPQGPWTINEPAGGGPGAVVGDITHTNGENYTITDAGTVNRPQP